MSSCDCVHDKCDQPYRIHKCGKVYLNLKPSKCILQDPVQSKLYKKIYRNILRYKLEQKIQNLIELPKGSPEQKIAYDKLLQELLIVFDDTLGTSTPRTTVVEGDGRVIYDTAQPAERNTVEHFNAGTVEENHNTRPAIMAVQLFEEGVSSSLKFSNTVGKNQSYVAVRAGAFRRLASTIRCSVNV